MNTHSIDMRPALSDVVMRSPVSSPWMERQMSGLPFEDTTDFENADRGFSHVTEPDRGFPIVTP